MPSFQLLKNQDHAVSKPKLKRSRNGCLSCKKLKIKCNEAKPICEYCAHTRRECLYPEIEPQACRKTRLSKLNFKRMLSKYQKIIDSSDLDNQILVNSNFKQLGVSPFEFQLLHFFQVFCVPFFTHSKNDQLDRIWRYEVPQLWQASPLIKMSIFSFATLNLWPLQGFDSLLDPSRPVKFLLSSTNEEEEEDTINCNKRVARKIPSWLDNEMPINHNDNLYSITSNYFSYSLSMCNDKVGSIMRTANSYTDEKTQFDHAELAISSILTFAFLGLHPHNVVPLVCFDGSSDTDFLGISGGMRELMIRSRRILEPSPYSNLFQMPHSINRKLDVSKVSYPIITRLTEELEIWKVCNNYDTVFDSELAREFEAYTNALSILQYCFDEAVKQNFPVPFFTWIMLCNRSFESFVRLKRPFALKVLFTYSCINILCRFALLKTNNIWMSYILWYKKYNERNDSHLDIYSYNWYKLIAQDRRELQVPEFSQLAELDPLDPD